MSDKSSNSFEMAAKPYRRDYIASLMLKIITQNGFDVVFLQRRLIDSEDAKSISKKTSDSINTYHKIHLVALSIKGSTSKNMHSVALVVDPIARTIRYQDPMGRSIPGHLKKRMKDDFPDYELSDLKTPQQKDKISCAVITVDNLIRAAQGLLFDDDPDTNKLRKEHAKVCAPVAAPPQTGKKSGKKFKIKSL